jgi:hypothetical protein
MPSDVGFLSCALYLPRRNDLLTKDVDEAFWGLAGAGFAPDPQGKLRIAEERRIPEVSGEVGRARMLDGAINIDQAIRQLRRVVADNWGQIMLRGQFAIGGRFEQVTAVVCPFSASGPGLFTAHILFREPGLLTADRLPQDRVAHALEAIGRLSEAMSPVMLSLDTQQFDPDVQAMRAGRIPWVPWAGYLAPGALRTMGGGGLSRLPEWMPWLEKALDDQSVGGARKTQGGGLMWVLPKPGLGRPDDPLRADPSLGAWWQFLEKVMEGGAPRGR